jgi:hypothetical protein
MIRNACVEEQQKQSSRAHKPTAAVAIAGVALIAVIATAGTPAWAKRAPRAQISRTLNVRDAGRLHFIRSSGSLLLDEGTASGTLPGRVQLRFIYDGSPSVSAQLTISGAGWSIRAKGRGTLSSPTSPNPSFRGSLTITGGGGRYAHAAGSGEMFGVFNRRNYGLTVQAIGKLSY